MSEKRAVVLLSGGLDSTTCAAIARAEGYAVYGLSVRYGQRHTRELDAAAAVAKQLSIPKHIVVDIDLAAFGGSALTDAAIEVPKARSEQAIGEGVPVTYVPARNTVLLSLALGWAEVLAAEAIYIGVNALDYSGYPDCRPEFIDAFRNLARYATALATEDKRTIEIRTPLQDMTKADIVRKGLELGIDYGETFTCYAPEGGLSCGSCDACVLRKRGFAEAGTSDPLEYAG